MKKRENIKFWFSKVFIVGIIRNTEKNYGIFKNTNCVQRVNKKENLYIKRKLVKENDIFQKKRGWRYGRIPFSSRTASYAVCG